MKINKLWFLTLLWVSLFFVGCNPANNTAINRFYHSTTAQYNGYFNANLLLDDALRSYRENLREDYYSLLPIEVYPKEADVEGLYPAIDTAIAKCSKVIQEHSMPGSAKAAKKKEENNSFIDENWITIGKASYMRRDYIAAQKNFQFIKKFYSNDPSNYIGELWMAKTALAVNKVTEAGFHLDAIKQAIEDQKEISALDRLKAKFDKKKKKGEKEQASVPRELYPVYYLTRAQYHQAKKEDDKLIENLELALEVVKKKKDKARIYFILGQLEEAKGNRINAQDYYAKVLKCNAPYDMAFSARLKRAFLGANEKLIKDLNKMLKDAKNAEYRDQIYYALAQIELEKNNKEQTFVYLTASAFYSTSNARQKSMAYEQMGDLRFKEKNYVIAQKYYDSCAQFMPETYPNAEGIRNKALKLNDLVVAVESAQREDSLLRISAMGEAERIAYVENVIEILKERERIRKKKEAEKLAELAKNESAFNQTQGGSKWYFRNAKTRAEGFDDFKRQWGVREDEDNWRRSEKIVMANNINIDDSTGNESGDGDAASVSKPPIDSLTVEQLMKDVPLNDSSIAASQTKLCKALYDAGIIYKDQLNEPAIAAKQFNGILEKSWESEYKPMSAFELYRMNEKTNPTIASVNKSFLLNNYPNSDYANYLRDPDYFIKKKEMDAFAEKEYVQALNRYSSGLYYPVLTKAENIIANEPTNAFRSKYILLKAMCQGRLNADKSTMKPTLELVIAEYPNTDEATRAKEMLSILENGYSTFTKDDFSNKSIYKYNDKAKMYVMIFLPEDENTGLAKSKISDFSREFFSRDRLKVSSKIYGTTQSIVLVEDFDTDLKAKEYIRVYQKTRKHLFDLQNAKIIAITQENLRILFETQKLQEYEDFFLEYY